MSAARLWIETTYHGAFRHGGWAYLRQTDGAVTGAAGGQRGVTQARLELTALIALLTGLPAGAAVTANTSSPSLMAALRMAAGPRAAGSDAALAEDLDLWAPLLTLANGRALAVQAAPRAALTPAAFLAAWAEVGQDRAKTAGRFSAAIPKPNLAKVVIS